LPFENQSAEPGLGALLTDSLVEEFSRRGVLRPLHGGRHKNADLVLQGSITGLKTVVSAFSSVSLTVEDRLEVELDVFVMRSATMQNVWERNGWVLSEQFLSSPDPQVYESNKEQALRRLSAEIAGRIHDELFQRF
jgi:hypothetical protein